MGKTEFIVDDCLRSVLWSSKNCEELLRHRSFMVYYIFSYLHLFIQSSCLTGMDAQVSYAFHSERKLHPEKFKNQLVNQVFIQQSVFKKLVYEHLIDKQLRLVLHQSFIFLSCRVLTWSSDAHKDGFFLLCFTRVRSRLILGRFWLAPE